MKKILVINTGSTSTKLALYHDQAQIYSENIQISLEFLEGKTRAVQQLEGRVALVRGVLDQHGTDLSQLDMIVARGGPVPDIQGGAYAVTDYMLDILIHAPKSQHESALACMIGRKLADPYGLPVIIYDAISSNEAQDVARVTGFPGVPTSLAGHPLNSRRAARKVAESIGIAYEDGCFIVAHLGGSISVSAHRRGSIVDMSNAFSGPMSPQRAGRIPTDELLKLCFSGKYTYDELRRKLNGKSGLMGYFGTQDARKVFELAEQGNAEADLVIRTMAYQVAKSMAEMRIALGAAPDALIMTGGMAHSHEFTALVQEQVSFLGPVVIVPGEMEMEALSEGAFRVLEGLETAKIYDAVPRGYASKDDFYAKITEKEALR